MCKSATGYVDQAGLGMERFLHLVRLGGTLRKDRRGRATSLPHDSDTVVLRIEEGMVRLYYFVLLFGPGGLHYHLLTRAQRGRHCLTR